MPNPTSPPGLWIDVEQGARFGDAADAVNVVDHVLAELGPIRDVWLFSTRDAAHDRGFYYPRSTHVRHGVPLGEAPRMVLIDDLGHQVWLSGASCRPEGLPSARRIMQRLGLHRAIDDSYAHFDEIHIVDGELHRMRTLDQPARPSPPGQTFIRDGRVVTRMVFDMGGVDATDLRRLWLLATEPRAWLGRPTGLLRYDSKHRSHQAGHDGAQLIATGETGRELWLQLPEPDEYHRVSPGRRRDHYEGSFTEYESATNWIIRSVGGHPPDPDDRSWRHKLTGNHRPEPPVMRWP